MMISMKTQVHWGIVREQLKKLIFRTSYIGQSWLQLQLQLRHDFHHELQQVFIILIIPDYRRESGGRSMTPEESQMEDLAGIKVK